MGLCSRKICHIGSKVQGNLCQSISKFQWVLVAGKSVTELCQSSLILLSRSKTCHFSQIKTARKSVPKFLTDLSSRKTVSNHCTSYHKMCKLFKAKSGRLPPQWLIGYNVYHFFNTLLMKDKHKISATPAYPKPLGWQLSTFSFG